MPNNSILTPTAVTRESLRVLHQKLNFIGNINRDYDDSFAQKGGKIGDALKIRLPNQYTVRTGKALAVQDTSETSVDLTVATQKGVDMSFSSAELTLSLDDFSERIIEPAMSVLAADIEADALSMALDVYNQVDGIGTAIDFRDVLNGRKKLVDNLAPTNNRCVTLNTLDNVDMVDTLKGLFQDSTAIKKQYKEGMMGRTAGFDFYENTLLPRHTTGSNGGSGYLVNGASQTGSSLVVDTGAGTLTKGDVFTIAGVNRVHPETKQDTAELQQFVVTTAHGGGAGTISISPAIVATGARQNVTASPADNAAITKVGGANAAHNISLGFQKDAFTFVTADLVKPEGVDWCARQVMDGIAMRIVRQYTISDDELPCRLDVLYGYKTLRAEHAVRYAFN